MITVGCRPANVKLAEVGTVLMIFLWLTTLSGPLISKILLCKTTNYGHLQSCDYVVFSYFNLNRKFSVIHIPTDKVITITLHLHED